MSKRVFLFLIINFVALAAGSYFTADGVVSDWYLSLNKAPWTPPGWVFGAAWTFIMVCFAFFMAFAWNSEANKKKLVALFAVQWILNVSWNPIFFGAQEMLWGLLVISGLTLLVGYFFVVYFSKLGAKALLIAPYFIWLIIATSLNGYIIMYN